MGTMKMIQNTSLKSRMRQVLFLLIIILIGILVTRTVAAKAASKEANVMQLSK